MTQAEFVAALGPIFEETPSIAERAWHQRPFISIEELWQAMVDIVKTDSAAKQLALIKAHPDLGSRAGMAEASMQEQAGAGLSQMSKRNYDRFHQLNNAYKQKFGFPFVMAVKGYRMEDILQAFEERLENDGESERVRSLFEIFQIARFRLEDCID
ncbi:OHCU decarboxylase [Synechococcus sp. PCC 7335]|nr:OHCU decarboxylase [Synechococcus sp. PCC 7335]